MICDAVTLNRPRTALFSITLVVRDVFFTLVSLWMTVLWRWKFVTFIFYFFIIYKTVPTHLIAHLTDLFDFPQLSDSRLFIIGRKLNLFSEIYHHSIELLNFFTSVRLGTPTKTERQSVRVKSRKKVCFHS